MSNSRWAVTRQYWRPARWCCPDAAPGSPLSCATGTLGRPRTLAHYHAKSRRRCLFAYRWRGKTSGCAGAALSNAALRSTQMSPTHSTGMPAVGVSEQSWKPRTITGMDRFAVQLPNVDCQNACLWVSVGLNQHSSQEINVTSDHCDLVEQKFSA